ncbi:MAG TPA: hypothetical protein VNR40_21300 [Steroidobacter sp.]|nr:hypothetical protein [Steroidobacter sp.]
MITEHLAKASRYCGATPGVVYSVAEHSVRCARAAWEGTGDDLLAKYMLCHDMHEAYLGDDTTPKKRALGSVIGQFGILASAIDQAFAELTDRIDRVIHQRAGLAWPPSPEMRKAIKHWDRVLLATEWRDLMRMPPPYDFGCEPLFATIVPFSSWQEASSSIEWACWSNGFRDGP